MQMKCFLPEPRFPLEPCTVANGVGTAAMLERSTLRLLLCVVQLMTRRLSSPAMGRLKVVVDGGGARCAGGWKASLSAQRVCRELPWQGPGPHSWSMTACADRARWLTHPSQPMGNADSYSLDRSWAATTDISVLQVVSVCARWMLADVQWFCTRTLMHVYGQSAAHSSALFELDTLHASDHFTI